MEHHEVYDNVSYQVLPDREGPYYLGEKVGFAVRAKNLLNEPLERKFGYNIHFSEGMAPHHDQISIRLEPHEERTIPLGDPIFLGFLGIFRVVLRMDIMSGAMSFMHLFAGYSRDREGHELQKSMEKLTKKLTRQTNILALLTAALFVLTAITNIPIVLQWIGSLGWGA